MAAVKISTYVGLEGRSRSIEPITVDRGTIDRAVIRIDDDRVYVSAYASQGEAEELYAKLGKVLGKTATDEEEIQRRIDEATRADGEVIADLTKDLEDVRQVLRREIASNRNLQVEVHRLTERAQSAEAELAHYRAAVDDWLDSRP